MEMTQDTVPAIARTIIEKAHTLVSAHATVITLEGDLGAGKTTLTQEIARVLMVRETVISPTFVIMKKYDVVDPYFTHLVHIDAYRLTKSEELNKLGFQELLKDPTVLIIIEWPEHVPECIPTNAYSIRLSHTNDDTTRSIEL